MKDYKPTEDSWENAIVGSNFVPLFLAFLNCEQFNIGYNLCSHERLGPMLITSEFVC